MKCKLHKQIFASALGLIVFFPYLEFRVEIERSSTATAVQPVRSDTKHVIYFPLILRLHVFQDFSCYINLDVKSSQMCRTITTLSSHSEKCLVTSMLLNAF